MIDIENGNTSQRLSQFFIEARAQGLLNVRSSIPNHFDVHSTDRLVNFLSNLAEALRLSRTLGDLINPWKIAGLNRKEVPNVAVLAALLSPAQTGDVGTRFLIEFLRRLPAGDISLPSDEELADGYHLRIEHRPDGSDQDRVDLVIETSRHVIGIEVKIGAREGRDQLSRYVAAIERMAHHRGKFAVVILLAPFKRYHSGVMTISWSAIRDAALAAVPKRSGARSYSEQLIADFAHHVARF